MNEIAPPRRDRVSLAGFLIPGMMAAWLLPANRPGVGWAIVGASLAIAIAIGGAFRDAWQLLHLASVAALFGTAVVTDSGWILAVNILAALASVSLAATGARTWREAMVSPLRLGAALPAPIRWVWGGVASFADRGRRHGAALRGTATAGLLTVIFGSLFVSADAAFARLATDTLVPDLRLDLLPVRLICGSIVAGLCGAAIAIRGAPAEDGVISGFIATDAGARTRSLLEWGLPLVALNALFAIFVALQVSVMFGGERFIRLTPGVTYAEYARSGFFQLLIVAGLVLAVVAGTTWLGRDADQRERWWMRAGLGCLCSFTLVILVSAWMRLDLYVETYGLTRLRLSVGAAILWLGVVFLAVLIAGARWSGAWLPRAVFLITIAGLIGLSAARPDAIIARYNVDRFERTGRVDARYLSTLSADAIPELQTLPVDPRNCIVQAIAARRLVDGSWASFSFPRSRAADALRAIGFSPATVGLGRGETC